MMVKNLTNASNLRKFALLAQNRFDIVVSEIGVNHKCRGNWALLAGKPAGFCDGIGVVCFGLQMYGLLQILIAGISKIVFSQIISSKRGIAAEETRLVVLRQPRIADCRKVPEVMVRINNGYVYSE